MSNDTEFRGDKYDKNLRTPEIARLVRKDIKAAIAAKQLPAGIKVSVRSSSYSGGSSIRVSVQAFPGPVLNPAQVFANALHVYESRTRLLYSAHIRRACAVLSRLLNAYHRDNSDTQTDYFDVNFYAFVDVGCRTDVERSILLESEALADLRVAKAAGEDMSYALNGYDSSAADDYELRRMGV